MIRFAPLITSAHNTWIKSLQRLHRSAERRSQKKFLIEGTHLIEEAIATRWPLAAICFDSQWAESNQSLLESVQADPLRKDVILQPVSKEVLARLGSTDSACMVVGVAVSKPIDHSPLARQSLAIAVESLQDPGNLGSLIRIAAAANLSSIILSPDSVDPTNPKVLRATAGQWFRTPPIVTDLPAQLESQRSMQVQILAAAAEGESYWNCDLTKPTMLVLGNEGAGLSPQVRSIASGLVSIPMCKEVESLNVAVCGALLIFEAQRQRRT
ncbi:MAG: RNA methyltransferase [Pirellula sp.]